MAWEQRDTRTYYYRSRRVGGRVVKEYFGNGLQAELAAREDAWRQGERAEIQARLQLAREASAEAEAAGEKLREVATALMRGSLIANGFRQHDRGEWRRRRHDHQ